MWPRARAGYLVLGQHLPKAAYPAAELAERAELMHGVFEADLGLQLGDVNKFRAVLVKVLTPSCLQLLPSIVAVCLPCSFSGRLLVHPDDVYRAGRTRARGVGACHGCWSRLDFNGHGKIRNGQGQVKYNIFQGHPKSNRPTRSEVASGCTALTSEQARQCGQLRDKPTTNLPMHNHQYHQASSL